MPSFFGTQAPSAHNLFVRHMVLTFLHLHSTFSLQEHLRRSWITDALESGGGSLLGVRRRRLGKNSHRKVDPSRLLGLEGRAN